jgi:hypothetical protein
MRGRGGLDATRSHGRRGVDDDDNASGGEGGRDVGRGRLLSMESQGDDEGER